MKHPAPEPTVPTACPDCESDKVKGPDQPGTGLAYWRCLACGIVWNPERPRDANSTYRSSTPARPSRPRDTGDYWKNR
jgi:rubredoxin